MTNTNKPPRYKRRPEMGVDPKIADLAELLLADEPGATDEDVTELAECFQRAFEDACQAIEGGAIQGFLGDFA